MSDVSGILIHATISFVTPAFPATKEVTGLFDGDSVLGYTGVSLSPRPI